MLSVHQRITWRRNIAENFNRLSRVHERYRRQTTDRQRQTDRQTDGRTTTYSEHEHEFTFAKKEVVYELSIGTKIGDLELHRTP